VCHGFGAGERGGRMVYISDYTELLPQVLNIDTGVDPKQSISIHSEVVRLHAGLTRGHQLYIDIYMCAYIYTHIHTHMYIDR